MTCFWGWKGEEDGKCWWICIRECIRWEVELVIFAVFSFALKWIEMISAEVERATGQVFSFALKWIEIRPISSHSLSVMSSASRWSGLKFLPQYPPPGLALVFSFALKWIEIGSHKEGYASWWVFSFALKWIEILKRKEEYKNAWVFSFALKWIEINTLAGKSWSETGLQLRAEVDWNILDFKPR